MLDFIKNGKGEILKLFFENPDKDFYLTEIAKVLGKDPAYYQRILDSFSNEGLLSDERRGNMRFFKLNKNYPLYEEIKRIYSKTLGLEKKINELIGKLPEIECAFLFGSIASGQENMDSDIDLMLIGKVDQDFLTNEVAKIESEVGREVNYHIYNRKEVIDKLAAKDSFFVNVFSSQIITLKGEPDIFKKLSA